jgi:hypothetical protein
MKISKNYSIISVQPKTLSVFYKGFLLAFLRSEVQSNLIVAAQTIIEDHKRNSKH